MQSSAPNPALRAAAMKISGYGFPRLTSGPNTIASKNPAMPSLSSTPCARSPALDVARTMRQPPSFSRTNSARAPGFRATPFLK